MINEREVEIKFEAKKEKLDLEYSLASMHLWLEGKNHIELVKKLWEKCKPGSNMTSFLNSSQATPQNIIGLISHLVHKNYLNEYKAILCLMEMSEEGIQKIVSGEEDFEW